MDYYFMKPWRLKGKEAEDFIKQVQINLIKESFLPLGQLIRTHVTTEEAAFYLNRKPQTLRSWACSEKGLIKPVRLGGRLAWKVDDIKKLLGE